MSADTPLAAGPKALATANQSAASDPSVSVWVAANAGSGKTHVLAQRVIRLLLSGVKPGRILCLTYTKAAAANMANRVLATLGRFVSLPEPELDAAIRATHNVAPTPELRARARRLFAAALETPGGLKIQTIHAFCGGLLHRFPFEAGVAAGFRELDEVKRLDLLARIRADLVVEAAGAPDGPLGRALARLTEELSDQSVDTLIEGAIEKRAAIEGLGEGLGEDGRAIRARVAAALGLDPSASAEAIADEMLESPFLPRSEWANVAAALATSDKVSDHKVAAAFQAASGAAGPEEALSTYRAIFLTAEGAPRKSLVTKGFAIAYPDLSDRLLDERDRIAQLTGQLKAAAVLERTEAALVLGAEACRRYGREKAERGLLDFDDLVARTAELLGRVPSSFVHFKLDQGIDHILLDEAQDTSPEQWQVIRDLVDEFFAGAGARGLEKRTFFVVGDEKQSIFSFQGADPLTFNRMRFEMGAKAGGDFRNVRLPHSFRSAEGILDAVDRVFRGEGARAGLTAGGEATEHRPIRADAPALVEIWPTVTPAPRAEVDDWRRPLDETREDDPVNTLARRVAAFVGAGIAARRPIPARGGRGMRAGDVLILVRRRGKLFEALIRALKEEKTFAVAGADRLVVAEHMAALDLMALGDALLSPDDDLALAGILKSPLFGFTDDHLMALCPGRPGRLHDAIEAEAPGNPAYARALARLEAWRGEAVALKPFDFYTRVLGRDGGRRALIARLGPEAGDVLDEFLTLARTYEGSEVASLAGFLAFLRRGGAETKRDMESERDEVRVMTVHGAKGLEAPIVILADTVDVPRARSEGGFLMVPMGNGGALPVVAPAKAMMPQALSPAMEAARARELDEYRRLLYVALTRAEDMLVVCGAETKRPGKEKDHARPAGCWYDLVREALEGEATAVPALGFEGEILRWRATPEPSSAPAHPGAIGAEAPGPLALLPILPPGPAPRVLRPSLAHPATPRSPSARPTPRAPAPPHGEALPPLLRGDLVHRLLAGLAPLPHESRREAGLRLLAHAAHGLAPHLHDALVKEALDVLAHAPLADLFAADGMAEVPIAGRLHAADGGTFEISGRIDRLVAKEGRLILADFKTDAAPPESLADTGAGHVPQLALYGAVLKEAMPGSAIEARLIYTRSLKVFVLGEAELQAALETLLAARLASLPRDAP